MVIVQPVNRRIDDPASEHQVRTLYGVRRLCIQAAPGEGQHPNYREEPWQRDPLTELAGSSPSAGISHVALSSRFQSPITHAVPTRSALAAYAGAPGWWSVATLGCAPRRTTSSTNRFLGSAWVTK